MVVVVPREVLPNNRPVLRILVILKKKEYATIDYSL
jgi:hypothetical protein